MSAREVIARARCMRRLDKPICEKLCEDCLYWADNDLAALDAAGLEVRPKEMDREKTLRRWVQATAKEAAP